MIVILCGSWLRGWIGAEGSSLFHFMSYYLCCVMHHALKLLCATSCLTGYDGRPHPDNATHEKYGLCVDGITQLKANCASILPACYVWLDFGCINQNGNPAGELKQLDKIVQSSDCIFTPIGEK